MFVNLPVYLAIGAALGFAWANYVKVPFRPQPFAVVYVLIFASAVFFQAPTWAKFDLGALLLGGATGRWFAYSKSDRDKAILLGFAGVLVVVAALQYDLGILNGLTKFGAGSVSVEFTPQVAKQGPTPIQGAGQDVKAFPGAGRLDSAIDLYRGLADAIQRDEDYARTFAGPSPGRINAPLAKSEKDERLREYKEYAEKVIEPVAVLLCFLHNYERGEESNLTIDPRLVLHLRRSYQMALSSEESVELESKSKTPVMQTLMGDLVEELRKEKESLRRLSQRGADDTEAADESQYYKRCGVLGPSAEYNPTSLFASVAAVDLDAKYGYLGYMAITAAVAEFAFGNRENAVQLLDREIRRQMLSSNFLIIAPNQFIPCEKLTWDRQLANCDKSNEDRLEWFRRLFLLARLESVQNTLLDSLEDDDTAVIPVYVTTLERSISHLELAFANISSDALVRPKSFEGNIASDPGAACADLGDAASAQKLARVAFSIVTAQNNELWISATHPEVIVAEPSRVAYLDNYVENIAAFDFGCLVKFYPDFGSPLDSRRRFLDTAAAYWEARGRRFGVSADDEHQLRRMGSTPSLEIVALCKAETANRLALDALDDAMTDASKLGPAPDTESALDQRVQEYYTHSKRANFNGAILRVKAAIGSYPQGDVDKYCPTAR